MSFVVGQIFGFSVHRRRGSDDNTVNVVVSGSFEDGYGSVDIVVIDRGWLLDAFANAGLGGLVVDYVGLADEPVDEVIVGDCPFNEPEAAAVVSCGLTYFLNVALLDTEIVVGDELIYDSDIVPTSR
jgi:hypothetical protein